jgi:hypothetical protein
VFHDNRFCSSRRSKPIGGSGGKMALETGSSSVSPRMIEPGFTNSSATPQRSPIARSTATPKPTASPSNEKSNGPK